MNPQATLPAAATVLHFDWAPDGTRLAMTLKSGEIWIWDWEEERRTEKLSLPEGRASKQVSWSPRGDVIAICEKEKISLWQPAEGGATRSRELPGRLASAAWGDDGRTLNVALLVGSPPTQRLALATWELESDRMETVHENPAWERRFTCGFSSDRRWMIPLRTDGHLEVWDLQSPRRVRSVRGTHRDMGAVAVSRDQTTLAVSFGGEVDLWDLTNGELQPPLGRDEPTIYSLAFSPGGELLAGKSRQGSIRLWRCKDWSERREIPEPSVLHQSPEIAFHPTEPWLATYDRRNTALRIWTLEPAEIPPLRPRMRKILFLSADPSRVQPLKTGRELREIREKLNLGNHWDRFEVHDRTAVRPEDIQGALQELEPEIVHFASHGDTSGSLLMEGPSGEPSLISQRALTNLLALFSDKLECVVLNVCHSEVQARSISQVVEHVIGMSSSVNDQSAIAFSTGFYQALGNGLPIARSYRFGCSLIDLKGLPGYNLPVLFQRGDIVPLELPVEACRFGGILDATLPADAAQPVVEEMEGLRGRLLAGVERILRVQDGKNGIHDRARLADLLSRELFESSPDRDLQAVHAGPSNPGSTSGFVVKRISDRLLEEGFTIPQDVCGKEIPALVDGVRRLHSRILDPHALTRSDRGKRFDPSIHELCPGCTGREGESVVEYSMFPGYKPLRELVYTTEESG